jgi:uncharacterized FlgJ-related protein
MVKIKAIAILLLLFSPIWEFKNKGNSLVSIEKLEVAEEISHQGLYDQIVESGIKFPEIAFVQAIIESGNFKSRLFKNHNNLFGMRFPGKRQTTSIGRNKKGYARYEDWNDSVTDYYFWQSFFMRKKNVRTREEYLDLLDDVYAEDKSYVSVIRRKVKQYKHIFD